MNGSTGVANTNASADDRDAPRASERSETVLTVDSYDEAREAVTFLGDAHFPVERTRIVATGIRIVERVVARKSGARAAVDAAVTGALIGGLVGLAFRVVGLNDEVPLFGMVIWGLLIGAASGGVIGVASNAANKGLASVSSLDADEYEVLVEAPFAREAASTLNEWALSKPGRRLNQSSSR